MAAKDDFSQFPRGQVSFDSGPLQNCTTFSATTTNGAKLVNTLRSNPAGFTIGKKGVEASFDLMIDETGDERDWDAMVDKGTVHRLRLKKPGGKTKTLLCVLTSVSDEITIEDGVKRALKLIGKWVT